jgi:hypothetical protein
LKDAGTIRAAIRKQLDAPVPAAGPLPGVPSFLTPEQAEDAAIENAAILTDPRSVRVVQSVVNGPQTGSFDAVTSQLIANLQRSFAFTSAVDGVIDDDVFHFFVARLMASGEPDALIRVVVDRQRWSEAGVVSVAFDPALAEGFRIETGSPGAPAALTFGQATFSASADAASVVHTIAHAYEDLRLRREGRSQTVREFLAIRIEILSRGMEEESIGGLGHDGFIQDAADALRAATRLNPKERSQLRSELHEVRNRVQERFDEIDPRTLSPDERKLLLDWGSFAIP